MSAVRSLVLADMRNIARDSMTKLVTSYPVLLGVVLHYLVPYIERSVKGAYDMSQIYPLIVGFFGLTIMPSLGGLVVGMLLLDERDTDTLTALQVTPLSMRRYVGYRLLFPMALSVVGTFIIMALMGLMPVNWLLLTPIALMGALGAPIYALLYVLFAANKVQGLAIMKGLSLFMSAPFAAWWVPEPWQWLLGVLPTYWPLKAFWELQAGRSIWPWLAGGLVVAAIYLFFLIKRFNRGLYRTD